MIQMVEYHQQRVEDQEVNLVFGSQSLGGASGARPPFWGENSNWTMLQIYRNRQNNVTDIQK